VASLNHASAVKRSPLKDILHDLGAFQGIIASDSQAMGRV